MNKTVGGMAASLGDMKLPFRTKTPTHSRFLIPRPSTSVRRASAWRCSAGKGGGGFDAAGVLGKALRQEVSEDSASAQAAAYLRELGITNRAELSQVIDITMNPNSLFRVSLPGPRSDSRGAPNRLARQLNVDADIKPVVELLVENGLSKTEISKIILEHPPILNYGVERLQPLLAYMENEVGVPKPAARIFTKRPSLAGLKADENLARIVGYFRAQDYSTEKIIHLLETSI
mmetsp:Transcript_7301/g.13199  ORF Transcript_7301/g.13199 Transcript_7301/m.13199 type:complete len:232 (-) Transcript_7301:236-931(-)